MSTEHIDAGEELAHKALRFLTAGSVDDGKSTLIGRLLFDSRGILADKLDALEKRAAGAPIDLSLLTDGLEAEREQGITIDVAYQYFATKTRKFIIADAPGHEQYTRNMVTAAAGSDAAVVLVDITKLDTSVAEVVLLPQTRRHSLLARLLRVPSIVFAVNKLDAIDARSEQAFTAVSVALEKFAAEAGITVKGIVPVSALRGDNVATPSANWPWYAGPTLLQILETLPVTDEAHDGKLLVPVQYVARDDGEGTGHQHRVMWGRIAHGSVKAGDAVQIFPSGETAIVAAVRHAGSEVDGCEAASRPAWCWTVRWTCRAATGSSPRAAPARRRTLTPPWPGWTPSRPSSAASTGCAMATVGCRHASPPLSTGWTSTRSTRSRPTSWA
jgi:sulfate adenylyltransferase subunit 1